MLISIVHVAAQRGCSLVSCILALWDNIYIYEKPLPIRKPLFRTLAQVLLIRICINNFNEPPVPPKHSVLLFKLQNLLCPARGPSVGEVMAEP